MPKVQLFEGERGALPFIVDRNQKPTVTESKNGLTATRIPGRFSICDCINGNGRKYPKPVWEKNLAEGSPLKVAIAKNAAFGLLEHPSNGQVTLNSPICILVTDALLKEGKDRDEKAVMEVVGEITVLGTAEGQKLSALIDAGYNPLVSSRGFGSVLKDSTGVDVVQDDYICEGWDVVMKPSFETAELWPQRENKDAKEKAEGKIHSDNWEGSVTEDIKRAAPATTLKETVIPSSAPATAESSSKPQLTETSMDINTIKSRITGMRSSAVPTDPQRFAEGMNEMASIHQEIANYVAEDAKRTWAGSTLHEELKAVERSWSEAALAPAKQAAKLNESTKKVLRVTKALGEAACGLKKKLSEALKQNSEGASLIEDLTNRGKAWVAVADKRKTQVEHLTHKLKVACEGLDILTGMYKESQNDVIDLGRRVITLEFKEKSQTEEIQKLLKEAKKPEDIVAIREKLDPAAAKKDEVKTESKETTPAATDKKGEAAPVTEAKKESGAAAPETKPAEQLSEARVLVPSVRSITESVDMVKRLSASAK